MKQLFLILVLVYGTQAIAPDTKLWPFQTRKTTCISPGVQCLDCTRLVLCIDLGNGNFEEELLESCNDGNSCSTGACTDKPDPGCGIGKFDSFACTDIGMFPDPYDCQSFHICCQKDTVSLPQKCIGNYYYDPVSTYCKLAYKPATGCPSKTQIKCENLGDMDAHPMNKSIYYICVTSSVNTKELYPRLHVCPHGRIFKYGKCQ